jgi:hypothetical protein
MVADLAAAEYILPGAFASSHWSLEGLTRWRMHSFLQLARLNAAGDYQRTRLYNTTVFKRLAANKHTL